jgi:peptide chain release factor subunit 1
MPMITPKQLDQLARFDASGANVLSAYLDLTPERQLRRAFAIAFKAGVQQAREQLDERGREELARESERVETWLETAEPHGKSVAVFTCEPRGLWETHFLPARVADAVTFQPVPHVEPLLEILDEYERYAVAVVDKERARLFTVFMGQIEQADALDDFVPGKHDQGGWSQANYQRHHEAHVLAHLKKVVEHLSKLLERNRFDRLVIGGPEEATSELRSLLTHDLADRLVAVLPIEGAAGDVEVLERTLKVERRIEREDEQRLVDELFDAIGAGGLAACGLGDVGEALVLGKVQTLVLAYGAKTDGLECTVCGWLDREATKCRLSGDVMRSADVVDRAIQRARREGGTVEVVHDEQAERLSDRCGGVAAILRFR